MASRSTDLDGGCICGCRAISVCAAAVSVISLNVVALVVGSASRAGGGGDCRRRRPLNRAEAAAASSGGVRDRRAIRAC